MAEELFELEDMEIDEIDANLKLVDLLGVEELQKAQEVVSKMARVATLITDENGVPITEGTNFSRFCQGFCRTTEEGRRRCEKCDKMGAFMALEQKKPVYYYCHANLVDFAAPIMLKGRVIGSFIGGQVLAKEPNLEQMRQTAREIGVDEDAFVEAALETNIIPEAAIERCTNFIYEFAEMLSAMAYRTYIAKKESMLAFEAATAKTDFLANMSHEIRTPMNAILGMSQIALREDMSQKARNYIGQVRNSAEMLLTIINDILDYSKLDAGKMSIIDTEYMPETLVKEVSGIINSRVGNKDIEFIVDMDPALPYELRGDDVRLKQILVNLANNAVKFTEHGQVLLSLQQRFLDENTIMLTGSVTDTGMGIKNEDIGKLFHSFQQVDSKRNRKVEGTGLGLAIVKELVEAMHGEVHVESEYEKGSTFSFSVPQKVVNSVHTIDPLTDCPSVYGVIRNPYIKAQLQKDMLNLGVQYMEVPDGMLAAAMSQVSADYIFVEASGYTEEVKQIKAQHAHTKLVVICGHNSSKYDQQEGIRVLKKPLSVIGVAAVLKNRSTDVAQIDSAEPEIDFRAPQAKVLIVDDNEVNLSVAVGLLEPIEMQVDTAESGIKAVQMCGEKLYDIIFMDHMMPEMDGVEATQEIRKVYPEYQSIPIVALTANALAGNKAEFKDAGMNDFVAKPIELDTILTVLKKWLPADKIKILDKDEILKNVAQNVDTDSGLDGMHFLDTKYALNLLKSEKLYWKVMKDYYHMIDKKHKKIKECEVNEDISIYIVEVHALKSSSRQIGAISLSKKAENLEAAGNRHDLEMIHRLTDEMLEEYLGLQASLAPYFIEEETASDEVASTGEVSADEIKELLQKVKDAIDELDLDQAEEVVEQIAGFHLAGEGQALINRMKESIMDMDIDGCMEVIEQWEGQL